jgi:hypothetical protein
MHRELDGDLRRLRSGKRLPLRTAIPPSIHGSGRRHKQSALPVIANLDLIAEEAALEGPISTFTVQGRLKIRTLIRKEMQQPEHVKNGRPVFLKTSYATLIRPKATHTGRKRPREIKDKTTFHVKPFLQFSKDDSWSD